MWTASNLPAEARGEILAAASHCGPGTSGDALRRGAAPGALGAPTFARRLAALAARGRPRRWALVPYDQLTHVLGPLAEPGGATGVLMVQSGAELARRRTHRQKLALVLANMRHFALEEAARGRPVVYLAGEGDWPELLASCAFWARPVVCMEPAERHLRRALPASWQVVPHAGWLTGAEDFAALGRPPWRMDVFYRRLRQRTGILMEGGQPMGGRFSLDEQNRQPWRGQPPAPEVPTFPADGVTQEAVAFVQARFPDHPGRLDATALAATETDARALWRWAKSACMPTFGPFEDAMSRASRGLFHTRVSPLLNLHRLLPGELVDDVLELDIPLNSKEGFIRQVLGWREFVRHVHHATDGLRQVPTQNFYGAHQGLPPAYWDRPSNLACLDEVVRGVWEEGYSHHITRLMVLSNIATLLQVDPGATTQWFWEAYLDAYDWVVEPNVRGMGTYALGDLMVTKPYIAGAPYIDRMGDFCRGCAFDPKRNCPITPMYWHHLALHRGKLASNPRLRMPMAAAAKRSPDRRRHDRAVYRWVQGELAQGHALDPAMLPKPSDAEQ